MTEAERQQIDKLNPTPGDPTEPVPGSDIPKFRIPPGSQNTSAPESVNHSQVGQFTPEHEIIEPIENHVFIRPDQASGRSPSGAIIVPASVKEPTAERGEVLYVGPGLEVEGKFNRMKISRGDRILFHRHSGTAITVNGEELICMREPGVFGIIRVQELEK